MTGLSGNEMYCLNKKGLRAGELVIGNSVFSLGLVLGIGSSFRTLAGGEVTHLTELIHDGRQASYERLVAHAEVRRGSGITGVTNELIFHPGTIEFLSIGSCVHRTGAASERLEFTSSADGQELYCQLDCGFHPIKFVFGNVAYSIGIGGGIAGAFRSLARGEITEYSEIFNTTRHLALERITKEAHEAGANAVVGIQTSIIPFRGMQEMVMIGTASRHDALPSAFSKTPITSDLTNEEMWNLIHMGYMPIQLVLGVSVYSVGFVGGLSAFLKSFGRGEISELTTLIYEAREHAIDKLMKDAVRCNADDVVGIKVYVYQLGSGVIEFMAVGTAVQRMEGLKTEHDHLPAQAIIRDKDTFLNTAEKTMGKDLNRGQKDG